MEVGIRTDLYLATLLKTTNQIASFDALAELKVLRWHYMDVGKVNPLGTAFSRSIYSLRSEIRLNYHPTSSPLILPYN